MPVYPAWVGIYKNNHGVCAFTDHTFLYISGVARNF